MLNKEGVIFTDDIPYIDVSAVILSIGPLPLAVIKKINVLNTGRLKVAWDNSITNRMTKSADVKLISTSAYHGVMSLGETTEEEKEPTTAEINNTDEVLNCRKRSIQLNTNHEPRSILEVLLPSDNEKEDVLDE